MALNKGWILLNNSAKKIQVENWSLDIDPSIEMEIEDLPLDARIGIDLGANKRVVKCQNLWFTTQADAEEFIAYMKTMNATGAWKFEVQTNTAGAKFKFDGTNDSMDVFCTKIGGITKPAPGEGTTYKITMAIFREAG